MTQIASRWRTFQHGSQPRPKPSAMSSRKHPTRQHVQLRRLCWLHLRLVHLSSTVADNPQSALSVPISTGATNVAPTTRWKPAKRNLRPKGGAMAVYGTDTASKAVNIGTRTAESATMAKKNTIKASAQKSTESAQLPQHVDLENMPLPSLNRHHHHPCLHQRSLPTSPPAKKQFVCSRRLLRFPTQAPPERQWLHASSMTRVATECISLRSWRTSFS